MTTWDYVKNMTDEELIDLVMDYDNCCDEAIDEMVVRFQKLIKEKYECEELYKN
uniref:Uncharacterized protein n=1 Tax=viral metagenome TaxID=1070528 RepID=A0A6M3LL70_9ZZZZ